MIKIYFRNNSYLLQAVICQQSHTFHWVWPSKTLKIKRDAAEICDPCGNISWAKWPLLAVVSLWPLICLKSPKQQRGVARFYCPSMRKGDGAALAWWMGSNWESEAGIKELYPAIKLCCSQRSRTQNLLCLSVWVCVSKKLCYQGDSYMYDMLQQLDIKQYMQAHNASFVLCWGAAKVTGGDSFPFNFSIDCWVIQSRQTYSRTKETCCYLLYTD